MATKVKKYALKRWRTYRVAPPRLHNPIEAELHRVSIHRRRSDLICSVLSSVSTCASALPLMHALTSSIYSVVF